MIPGASRGFSRRWIADANAARRRPLFSRGASNAKTSKTESAHPVDVLILHLAPADAAGGPTVCAASTDGCRAACLYKSGRAGTYLKGTRRLCKSSRTILRSRIRRTRFLWVDRPAFVATATHEITLAIGRAARAGHRLAVRVNGTSDLAWLAAELASRFPAVTFYDYTKLPAPWRRLRPNYHLTFSRSETNEAQCLEALAHGVNVAVVFATRKGQPLPATWHGYRVVDGDTTDARFLDPAGVVVGLRAKGPAIPDRSGFVVAETDPACAATRAPARRAA